MRRSLLTVLFVAVAAASAGGCGSDPGDGERASDITPPTTVVTTDDLEGQSFGSTTVTGYDLVPDTRVSLTFAEHRVSAVAGCNTQNADVDIVDGRLQITSEIAATSMPCEDPLLNQDRWIADFLHSGPVVAGDGETLTLTAGDEVIELESKL